MRLHDALQLAVLAAASLAGHLGRMQMLPDGRIAHAPSGENQTENYRTVRLLECLEKGEDPGIFALDGERLKAHRAIKSTFLVGSAFGRTRKIVNSSGSEDSPLQLSTSSGPVTEAFDSIRSSSSLEQHTPRNLTGLTKSMSMRDKFLLSRSAASPRSSTVQKSRWEKLKKLVKKTAVLRAFGFKTADSETLLANRLRSESERLQSAKKRGGFLRTTSVRKDMPVAKVEGFTENPKLALKVSVAAGNICVVLAGGGVEDDSSVGEGEQQRWEFLVGDPLSERIDERAEEMYSDVERQERAEARKGVFAQIASVEGAAKNGDVVMTAKCAALIKDTWTVERGEDGAFRLNGLISPAVDSARTLLANLMQIKGRQDEGKEGGQAQDSKMLEVESAVASSTTAKPTAGAFASVMEDTDSKGTSVTSSPSTSATSTVLTGLSMLVRSPKELPLLREMKSLGATGGAAAVRLMRMHIPNPVRLRIEAGHQNFVNEMRMCTCMFVGFTRMANVTVDHARGVEAVASATAIAFESCIKALQDQVSKHGGTLLQTRCDEKGYLAICAWGLPGRTHQDDAARAVAAAVGLTRELGSTDGEQPGAVVGVTTGTVLCAVVHGAQRAEYTVFGDAINLSARLMCKAKEGMGVLLVDEPTQKAAKRAARFRKLAPLPVKGKAGQVQVYAVKHEDRLSVYNFTGDNHMSSVNIRLHFVGRNAELNVVEQACHEIVKQSLTKDAGDRERNGHKSPRGAFVAFHGVTGVGKTRMLQEATKRARDLGFVVLKLATVGSVPQKWRSALIETCRLLPKDEIVSIDVDLLEKWSGTPMDLVRDVASFWDVEPSIIPKFQFITRGTTTGAEPRRSRPFKSQSLQEHALLLNSRSRKELRWRRRSEMTRVGRFSSSRSFMMSADGHAQDTEPDADDVKASRDPYNISSEKLDFAAPEDSIGADEPRIVNRAAVVSAFAAIIATAAACGVSPLAVIFEDCDKLCSCGWYLLRKLCSIRAEGMEESNSHDQASTPGSSPYRCLIMSAFRPLNPSSTSDRASIQMLTLMGAERISLEPLDMDATKDIAVQLFGGREIDYSLAKLLHEKTGGIPLFMQQLAALLEQEGNFHFSPVRVEETTVKEKQGWSHRVRKFLESTDGGLTSAITSRIDALPAQQQLTLKVASVLGATILPGQLHAIHPLMPPAARLGAEISALVSAGFLRVIGAEAEVEREGGLSGNNGEQLERVISAAVIKSLTPGDSSDVRFEYVTSLMRDVVYALIPATTRQNFHLALACAVAGFPAPDVCDTASSRGNYMPPEMNESEVADHFFTGVDGRVCEGNMGPCVMAAAWYADRVGQTALMVGAGQEAAQYFERAAKLVTTLFTGGNRLSMSLPDVLAKRGWSVGKGVYTNNLHDEIDNRVSVELFVSWWRRAAEGWMMEDDYNEAFRCLSGAAHSIGAPLPASGTWVRYASGSCFNSLALACCGSHFAPYIGSDELPELAKTAAVLTSEILTSSGKSDEDNGVHALATKMVSPYESKLRFNEQLVKGGLQGLRVYALFMLDKALDAGFARGGDSDSVLEELSFFKKELLSS